MFENEKLQYLTDGLEELELVEEIDPVLLPRMDDPTLVNDPGFAVFPPTAIGNPITGTAFPWILMGGPTIDLTCVMLPWMTLCAYMTPLSSVNITQLERSGMGCRELWSLVITVVEDWIAGIWLEYPKITSTEI